MSVKLLPLLSRLTGDPGHPQQDGQHEADVDSRGEGEAVAGLVWEDVGHGCVSRCGLVTTGEQLEQAQCVGGHCGQLPACS